MINTAQAVLVIALIVLAILFVVLGIQVFFILRQLRQTVSKANKVLEDTGTITESVSVPISKISLLASGAKVGTIIASILKRKKKRNFGKDEDE